MLPRLLLLVLFLAGCAAPQGEPQSEHTPSEPVALADQEASAVTAAAAAAATVTEVADAGQAQAPAGAEELDPIEVKFEACQEAENYTTFGMNKCISEAIEDWDAELNRVYGAIMEDADEELAQVVRAAQRDWIAYRDSDLAVIQVIYSRTEGTYWGVEMGLRRIATHQNQVERLRWYLLMQN